MGQTQTKSPSKLPPAAPMSLKKGFVPQTAVDSLVQGNKVDMRTVTIMLWQHRNDCEYIEQICNELAKLIDEKPVLDQIEFYLPQVRSKIHLEILW